MATYYVDLNGNISTSPPNKKKKAQYYVDIDGNVSLLEQEVDEELNEEVVQKTEKNKFWKNWFEKGAFSDGYQLGDVSKTILGTVNDAKENLFTAVFDATENLIDTTAYGVGAVGGLLSDDFQDGTKDFIAKDLLKSKETGEWLANASNFLEPVGWATKIAGINDAEDTDEASLLGEKSEGLVQSVAHMVGSRALNAVGVPWQLTTAVNSFGSELERAFGEGAGYYEAGISGAANAAVEIGTESLFAGSGLGEKGLIDTSVVTNGIKNEITKTLARYGVDIAAEGSEEVIAEFGNKIVSSIYKDEAPELASWDAFHDYVDAFIGGAVMGGGMNVGKVNTSLKTGTDYNTGLTQEEQSVVDKETEKRISQREADGEKVTNKEKKAMQEQVVRDLYKGYISIDTIEETLGGDTYTAYQDSINKKDALQKEYDELYNMKGIEKSDAQVDRQAELKRQLDEMKTNAQGDQLKTKLSEEVKNLVAAPGKNGRNSLLVESYNEQARRRQKFDADLTKYKDKQKETIQRAIDSGILNNTNRTHEFVDLIAKISANKGVSFDFTNNAKLKESGFAVDGKTVNGYVTADGVTLNINSNKALNSVVGHEITHVLEGTELYAELQSAIKQYAESKGDYQSRVDAITKLYQGMDADIDAEVTADLVGDYLFNDPDFIQRLSTEHRNVFQKVYDEIKYLAKVATTGSKEARQLEKAKKVFEDAYRKSGEAQKNTATKDGVKYHISDTFAEEIDKTLNNEMPKGSQVKARDYTPEILVENGVKDLPMLITQSHVKTTIYTEAEAKSLGLPTGDKYHYHGLGKDLLMQSIDNMDNPLEIYRQDNDHYLIITEMKNSNGDSVIIPVKIDGKGTYNDVYIDENQIKTVYGKKNLEEYLARNNFELIYAKRSTALNEGVQFPNISGASQQIDKRSASEDIVPQNSEKSSGNSDVQYSLGDTDSTEYKINTSMTMAEAKRMLETAYKVNNIAEYYEGEYANAEDWLQKVGSEEVEMYIENDFDLQARYINANDDILNEEYRISDVLDAYRAGTLVGKAKPKPQRLDVSQSTKLQDSRFYSPQKIENAKSTFDLANQKAVGKDAAAIQQARAEILLFAHNKGAAELLGVTQAELNKKLRSWSNYSATARKVSERINAGVAEENRWTGIENSAYINKAKVTNEDIERLVASVEGDSRGYERKYIARVMLAADTHIDYSGLKFKFASSQQVNADHAGGNRVLGFYDDAKRLIEVTNDKPNTVAHEMGHYLDAQWGRDLLGTNSSHLWLTRGINAEMVKARYGEQGVQFLNNFKLFINSLSDVNQNNNSYYNDRGEIFARFFAKFVEWTDNIATGNKYYSYESTMYKDNFTQAQYEEFARLLQEKALLDGSNISHSLSNEGDIAPAIGSYNVYGKDIALEDVPIRDDLARVQDTVQLAVQESDFAPTSEAEANALSDESLDTFTDEDAPPVMEAEYDDFADTTALDPKALKDISKALKDVLYLNNKEVKAIGEVVQKYSTAEFPDKADLFYELQAKFGTKETVERNEETAAIKKTLREYPINVSQAIKKDITDYGAFMRRNFGKVRFSKEGVPVDSAYQDLSAMFPEYFPADITNASDQLLRISEIAGMEINETETFELSDEDIMEAVDVIEAEVGKYKEAAVQTAAEAERQAAFAHIDDIAPIRDDIAPAVEIPAPADTSKPIKTVKERLSAKLQNYQTELATNQQQRIDSQAGYEEDISRLYAEYSAKKNKNTKAANDILRRIDRMQTMKGNVDADYAKRISDLEAKVAQLTEEVRTGESPTEQAAMRSEVHTAIVDNIKTTFAEKGVDFDKVLANAKDLSTFSTVDNTPQRVLEKALGYKEGQILSDLTVNKVAQNETEGIKWLNDKVDLIKQISKQYHIKPGSKESAAAQMYAEGFYVNKDNEIIQYGDAELAKDFPDAMKQARIKGLAKDTRIRQIYDETLAAINESRARNAYPEIQRLDNYFLHFRAQTDTFSRLGIPFNPKDIRAKDLPTDLNGVTADLKPGQPYFASAMHRQGKRTSFDLLGGLEQYLTGAKDQIYHIDDIQTLRALRNYIADNYGQAKGLDNLDALTEEEAEAKIKEVFSGHLSTMAKFLNEEANVIAGKTALTDRGLEGIIGRRGITFLADLNKQVGANMVGFNISSSMTNVLSAVQGFAKTNKVDFVKAMAQYTSNKIKSINGKGDSFAEQSSVIVRRKGADRFHRTVWQKTSDAGYWLMGAVDNVSTEIIARAKYNELTRKGMDSQQAHQETDKWVSRLMGDRSLGQQPQLYNSKMLGMLTKFQLEVRNQLDSQFYDTIKEADVATEDIENALKRNSKKAAKIASTFFQLAVAQHLFGKAFESIAGYNPAFDIISVMIKTFGWDDDEDDDDTVLDNIEQGFQELLGDLPYTSTFTGGRIPISSALPIKQLVTGKDDYGNEKSRWETIKEAAPYYFMPGGYSQIKKTSQGLSMFSEKDKPYYFEVDEDGDVSKNFVTGSYTDSGNLRYPVEKNFGNMLQAGLFGQYANKNAREYFDDDIAPLKENQIMEYDMLDIPIADYWKYREGLAKQDTLEEKLDYIDDLDLPIDKKNILANNAANRESYIDLSDYDDFSGLEEFDFASKNPEKYEFFEQSGITYAAYANGDEDAKRAYNWAYENPEKYAVSRAVASDVVVYRQYARELSEINGKDANGETVNGLAKQRKFAYISSLDIDEGAKAILFKMEYPASYVEDNTFILQYIDSLEALTVDEKLIIARELGFTVNADGSVYW